VWQYYLKRYFFAVCLHYAVFLQQCVHFDRVIYESRPNVTIDAAALCLKSGNGVILRGGSEAINSNLALYSCVKQGLIDADLDRNDGIYIGCGLD
jgi:hypothetical protein